MFELPVEIWLEVFVKLEVSDISRVAMSCRNLNQICHAQQLWKIKSQESLRPFREPKSVNWYHIYQRQHRLIPTFSLNVTQIIIGTSIECDAEGYIDLKRFFKNYIQSANSLLKNRSMLIFTDCAKRLQWLTISLGGGILSFCDNNNPQFNFKQRLRAYLVKQNF